MLDFADKVHKSCVTSILGQLHEMDHPEDQMNILRESLEKNPFKVLQQDFRSYFLLDKTIRNSAPFKYVDPLEVKLGPEKKSSFQ
jgi:hypothetical protein